MSKERLNLRLVYAGKVDRDLPNATVDLKTKNELKPDERVVASDDDELDFPTPIAFPHESSSHGRVLVWSEAWRGRQIQAASADQRIEEEDGKLVGPLEHINVSYDPGSRRWFIPLVALVRSQAGDLDASRPHRLTLDLSLDDGTRSLIQVRLKFKPMTSALGFGVVRIYQPITCPGPDCAHLKDWAVSVPLRSTSISNPFARPITAWVRGDFELTLKSYVGLTAWAVDPQPRVIQPIWQYSATRLRLAPGAIRRTSGVSEPVGSPNARWNSIELAPHESITLNWNATPISNASCKLPASQTRVYDTYGPLTDFWSYYVGDLKGKGTVYISFTAPNSDASALESEDAPKPRTLEFDISEHRGGSNEAALPFSCQGWF
jgi:hypothetical protein